MRQLPSKETREKLSRATTNSWKKKEFREKMIKRQRELGYRLSENRATINHSLRYEILKRDNFHCKLCGRGVEDGVKLHVDHIKPFSKGGKTKEDNLRTLCAPCNMGKKDKNE